MRLLAIGDVHGNPERLRALLANIQLQPEDQLVMLGDYIDRGPDSKGVVNLLRKLQRDFPKTVFLRGNHEQMLLDTLHQLGILVDWQPLRSYQGSPDLSGTSDVELFEMNGGQTTLASYGATAADFAGPRDTGYRLIPREHIVFLQATRLFFRVEQFLFVHAGINPEDPFGDRYGPFELLWKRRQEPCVVDGEELTLVHGHTPRLTPLLLDREINLDTGAGYGRTLTCCEVRTGELWQV